MTSILTFVAPEAKHVPKILQNVTSHKRQVQNICTTLLHLIGPNNVPNGCDWTLSSAADKSGWKVNVHVLSHPHRNGIQLVPGFETSKTQGLHGWLNRVGKSFGLLTYLQEEEKNSPTAKNCKTCPGHPPCSIHNLNVLCKALHPGWSIYM